MDMRNLQVSSMPSLQEDALAELENKLKAWTCEECSPSGARTSSKVASAKDDDKQEKYQRCKECNDYLTDANMRRRGNRHSMDRCNACLFPICKACGRQRQEDEGPVKLSDKEKNDGVGLARMLWYCKQSKCQGAKKQNATYARSLRHGIALKRQLLKKG